MVKYSNASAGWRIFSVAFFVVWSFASALFAQTYKTPEQPPINFGLSATTFDANFNIVMSVIRYDNKIAVLDVTKGLFQFLEDGSFDPDFNGGSPFILPGGVSYSALAYTNDHFYIGTSNSVVKVTRRGELDATFGIALDGPVYVILPLGSNLAIGGDFIHVNTNMVNRFATFNSLDGSGVNGMGNGFDGPVLALAVSTDGELLVGGYFTQYGQLNYPGLVKTDRNGIVDVDFMTRMGNLTGFVQSIAVNEDYIAIGGSITNVGGNAVGKIAILESKGTFFSNVNNGVVGEVSALKFLQDGSLLVGGPYISIGGQPSQRFAVVESDMITIRQRFPAGFNHSINSIAVDAQNRVFIGGHFTSFANAARNYIAVMKVAPQLEVDADKIFITYGAEPIHVPVTIDGEEVQATKTIVQGGNHAHINDQGKIVITSVPFLNPIVVEIESHEVDRYLSGSTEVSIFVQQKELTIAGVQLEQASKIYDGTTTATIRPSVLTLQGVVGDDEVVINRDNISAAYESANAGSDITVNFDGYALDGANAYNYKLKQPVLTASITPKPLSVFSTTIQTSKVYDGTRSAIITKPGTLNPQDIIDGDEVDVISGIALYSSRHANPVKPIVFSGFSLSNPNYKLAAQPASVQGSITKKNISIINASVFDKEFDDSFAAVINNYGQLKTDDVVVVDGVTDNVVLVTNNATAFFTSKNIGTNIPVTFEHYTLSGADAGNYSLLMPDYVTASIEGGQPTFSDWADKTVSVYTELHALNATTNSPGQITYTVEEHLTPNGQASPTLLASITFNGQYFLRMNDGDESGKVRVRASVPASGNYRAAHKDIWVTITALTIPTLTFNLPFEATYGDEPISLTATSTSPNGVITFEVHQGPGDIVNNQLVIKGAGIIEVLAKQEANGDFASASVLKSVIVDAAELIPIVQDAHITYGDPEPTFVIAYQGLKNGDIVEEVVLTSPVVTKVPTSNPLQYELTAVGGITNSNYVFQNPEKGTLTLAPATLVAKATDYTVVYGSPLPQSYGIEYTGFKFDENASQIVSVQPTISVELTNNPNAGTYPIVLEGGETHVYYSLERINGVLIIEKATTEVTLSNLGPFVYNGTQHHASAEAGIPDVDVTITYNGSATAPANTGHYDVLAMVNAANFRGEAQGTMIINKASQSIAFPEIGTIPAGHFNFALQATASSGLPVLFEAIEGPITINNNEVTVTGSGTASIRALQGGNNNYHAAEPVTRTFDVIYDPILSTASSLDNIIHLYPVPARDYFTLECESGLLAVSVTDIMGKNIHEQNYTTPQHRVQLKVPSANVKIFFVRVVTRTGTETKKLIVE